MKLGNKEKQPIEIKDYPIDYSAWLAECGGDTINGASTQILNMDTPGDTSLEDNGTEVSQSAVRVWLRGGTPGQKYKVSVTVTTTGGRVDQSEFHIKIKES